MLSVTTCCISVSACGCVDTHESSCTVTSVHTVHAGSIQAGFTCSHVGMQGLSWQSCAVSVPICCCLTSHLLDDCAIYYVPLCALLCALKYCTTVCSGVQHYCVLRCTALLCAVMNCTTVLSYCLESCCTWHAWYISYIYIYMTWQSITQSCICNVVAGCSCTC